MARRVICGLIFSALVFVPFSLAARTSVSATGVISGSGTNYTLTMKNTGSDAIHCMRFFAPQGVNVTGAQGPSGAITQSQGNSFGSLELQAPP